jgi:hypothetical protein
MIVKSSGLCKADPEELDNSLEVANKVHKWIQEIDDGYVVV